MYVSHSILGRDTLTIFDQSMQSLTTLSIAPYILRLSFWDLSSKNVKSRVRPCSLSACYRISWPIRRRVLVRDCQWQLRKWNKQQHVFLRRHLGQYVYQTGQLYQQRGRFRPPKRHSRIKLSSTRCERRASTGTARFCDGCQTKAPRHAILISLSRLYSVI